MAALALTNASAWKMSNGAKVESTSEGLVFTSAAGAASSTARYSRPLTADESGRAAEFSITLKNVGQMVWANPIRVLQFDAAGKELPECVIDPRKLSHMRPLGKRYTMNERGWFHPEARSVTVELTLVPVKSSFDADGLPVADPGSLRARLEVSAMKLGVAGPDGLPPYRERWFGPGVSGQAGDEAIRLGGDRALWYATRSQACWAEGKAISEPNDCFYPDGEGTIEAWFKPSWKASDARSFSIFQGSHRNGKHERTMRRSVLELTYSPAKKQFSLLLVGMDGQRFEGQATGELKPEVWTHLAVQWSDLAAEIYLAGRRVLSLPLTGYRAWRLADASVYRLVDDRMPSECFLGSTFETARQPAEAPSRSPYYFEGLVDNWRMSSGCRYAGDFTPTAAFEVDARTRALFAFDHEFDGVSGGGLGHVAATTRDNCGRRAWPVTAPQPEFDSEKVFDLQNYTELSTAADFLTARRRVTKTFTVTPERNAFAVNAPKRVFPDYVEIANVGKTTLRYPAIFGEGEIDPRSFGDMRSTLSLGQLDDRGKVDRMFQFVLAASDYFMNHTVTFYGGSDVPDRVERNALRMLNGYCGFECGPLNNMTANIFATVADVPASQTGGYGHSFQQVFFDGKNHVYDLSAQRFFTAWDNRSAASLYELEDEPGAMQRFGTNPNHFIRQAQRIWEAQTPAYQEKIGVVLRPGERYRAWFMNNGVQNDLQAYNPKTEPPKDSFWHEDYAERCGAKVSSTWSVCRVNRFLPEAANGFIVFEGKPTAANPAFADEGQAFVYSVVSGLPIVRGEYAAELAGGRRADIEISTDRGQTFRPMPTTIDYPVRGRHEYLVRVKAPLKAVKHFRAVTETQFNRRVATGRVKGGLNRFRFTTVNPEPGTAAKVKLAWSEPAKEIVVEGGAYAGAIPGNERQLFLVAPEQPLSLAVRGVTKRAKVKVLGGPIAATLAGGRLQVKAQGYARPAFAALKLVDGEAEKEVTFLVAANARLALAEGRSPHPSPQPVALLRDRQDRATFRFAPLPAGKYVVLQLVRYEAHARAWESFHRNSLFVRFASPAGGEEVPASGPRNGACNYYKADFGVQGGRGNFKWDFPWDLKSKYISWIMRRFDFPEFDHLDYYLMETRTEPVELAAVLVLPAPDEEFYCELLKTLTGLNAEPWRVTYAD